MNHHGKTNIKYKKYYDESKTRTRQLHIVATPRDPWGFKQRKLKPEVNDNSQLV